jgi:TetR/AcrR family transcriptional regulator, mexJK operon transcriptional repressor
MVPTKMSAALAVSSKGDRSIRPGPGRPRKGEGEQRNKAVLIVALNLFLEKGFEGTTIGEILTAAGMTKRTLLQSYPTKASLFRAAMEMAVIDWAVPHEALSAAEVDNPEESLLKIAELLIANATSQSGIRLLRLTNAESFHNPDIGSNALEVGTRHVVDFLAGFFRRRFPNGRDFPEAEVYATSLMGMLLAPARLLAWGTNVERDAVMAHTQHCVKLFLRGIIGRE